MKNLFIPLLGILLTPCVNQKKYGENKRTKRFHKLSQEFLYKVESEYQKPQIYNWKYI